MNNNLTPVIPGTIILESGNTNASTSLNNAYYSTSESGPAKSWSNLLLGGFMNGQVPENIVFSVNGTVSNYFKQGYVYEQIMLKYFLSGMKNDPFEIGQAYGLSGSSSDAITTGVTSIPSFVGSARASIISNPNANTISITITNVTSINSGDYHKDVKFYISGCDFNPPFLHRDASSLVQQPYTNSSQTFRYQYDLTAFKKALSQKFAPPIKVPSTY